MSEASRAEALKAAIATHGAIGDHETILNTAEAYHDYIQNESRPATTPPKAVPAKAATPAPAPAKAKPAPAKAKVAPEPEDDDDAETSGLTKEEVGASVEAALNANLRKPVITLFAKYGAKSLGGVKPEDYAAFKDEVDDLLLGA